MTVYNEKSTEEIQCFFAPAGVELLNLWHDFRKVVRFIDENPWVKPMLLSGVWVRTISKVIKLGDINIFCPYDFVLHILEILPKFV